MQRVSYTEVFTLFQLSNLLSVAERESCKQSVLQVTGGNVLKWWKLDICVLVSTSLGMQFPLLMYSSLFFETKSTEYIHWEVIITGLMRHFRFALSFLFSCVLTISIPGLLFPSSHSQLDSCPSRWSLAYVPHCWCKKLNWWFWHYLFPGFCFSKVSDLFRVLQFPLYLRIAAVLTSELSNFAVLFVFVRWKHIKRLTCRLLKFLAKIMEEFVTHVIRNGNRTNKWSPIWSVIKIGRPHNGSPIYLTTSMITDQIGLHSVLFSIICNH